MYILSNHEDLGLLLLDYVITTLVLQTNHLFEDYFDQPKASQYLSQELEKITFEDSFEIDTQMFEDADNDLSLAKVLSILISKIDQKLYLLYKKSDGKKIKGDDFCGCLCFYL